MKKYIIIAVVALGCIKPTEPLKVHPPLQQIPSDEGAPIPSFTISCDGRICLFDAQDTKPNNLPIKAYGWSFGDASLRVMPGDIPSVQHTYKENGSYEVMLTVWDTQDKGGRLYKRFIVE
jgi:hypothetical protein